MAHKVDVYFEFDNMVRVDVNGAIFLHGPKEEVSDYLKHVWDVCESYGKESPGLTKAADACKRAWIKINYSPVSFDF